MNPVLMNVIQSMTHDPDPLSAELGERHRLTPGTTMRDAVVELCDGVPGSIAAFMQVLTTLPADLASEFLVLCDATGMVGHRVYTLLHYAQTPARAVAALHMAVHTRLPTPGELARDAERDRHEGFSPLIEMALGEYAKLVPALAALDLARPAPRKA